MDETLQTTFAA